MKPSVNDFNPSRLLLSTKYHGFMALKPKQRCSDCPTGWAYPVAVYDAAPPAMRKAGLHFKCYECINRWSAANHLAERLD